MLLYVDPFFLGEDERYKSYECKEHVEKIFKIINYGLSNLNEELKEHIRKNQIEVGDKTLILEKSSISFLSPEGNQQKHGMDETSIEVTLTFDVIDEIAYQIGGRAYEKRRERFDISKNH